jgi:membrane fusion protein, multidrug efflux system
MWVLFPFRNGALVSPGDATPLTTVAAIENVYAYFSMNEREYLNFIETASGTNLAEKIKTPQSGTDFSKRKYV